MSSIDVNDTHPQASASHVDCVCGEANEDLPEIDAQGIPHAIRHAAIFGAVDALKPGGALIVSASHNPVPLLTQLEARYEQRRSLTYLDKGPDRWRVVIRNVEQ